MRNTFINTIFKIAQKDKRVMLLAADIGYSVLEEFIEKLPKQYLNTGIAEQNTTGVAAGMAIEGRIPLIYSIIPFVTMRNFEQIRNDICYQNLNVKIIGIGAGFSYGPYAHTHHALEDIGILRNLPNLVIVAPGDPLEAEEAASAILKHKGPVYVRLGKKGEPNIHKKKPTFAIGKGIIIEEGYDLTLIATSNMLQRASEVVNELKKIKITTRLISMHTIKPLDKELVLDCAKKTKVLFTLEEHSVIGGLGSAVAEIIAESERKVKFRRFAVPDRFTKAIGYQDFMREQNDLSKEQLIENIIKTIKRG